MKVVNRYHDIVSVVFKRLCREAGTPLALAAYHRFKNGDYAALVSMTAEPHFYEWNGRTADYELDCQVVCFFKKYVDFPIVVDREGAAHDKWVLAEEKCHAVNEKFRRRWSGQSVERHDVEEVFHFARCKIRALLGSICESDMAVIRANGRHGPGADTAVSRRQASVYLKYQTDGEITAACVDAYDKVFGCADPDLRNDLAHDAKLTCASKLSFVPKTALIDRAICVEPRWNLYLQLGIGALIEKRLRLAGMDLRSQQRNQSLARVAITENLATVDLSSASDSIAVNLVIDMLDGCDPLWLDLLLSTRTPYTVYRGKRIRLEKISSMGNGFTFPLETLIFYAFAYAARKCARASGPIGVYGDDIILPRKAASLLYEALEAFGFSVNTSKSFANGSFYESCGADFMSGREVRPFYLKSRIDSLPELMRFHNSIIAWAGRNAPLPGYYNRSRWLLADAVFRSASAGCRYSGPISCSDGVFHRPFIDWVIARKATSEYRRRGFECIAVKGLCGTTQRNYVAGSRGLLYQKLSFDTGGTGHYIMRDSGTYKVKEITVLTRDDYVVETQSSGLRSAVF